jgi:hypothetical protein
MNIRTAVISAILLMAVTSLAQDPYPGLTIISSRLTTESYLIDMDGDVVKTWHGATEPGEFAYMFPDSSVMRPCRVPGAGGRGGRIQHIDANDTVIWDFTYATTDHLQHHDIEPMPNGNVLLVAWELYTIAEAEAVGRVDITNNMKVTTIVEIEPVGPTGGDVVWQWRAWDHLVQDTDAGKPNYGVVADHPGLIDINWGDVPSGAWMHTNAVDYNQKLDQIVISARNHSEVYVVDHSTTTEEAAGHTGGRWGKGGDILYRWGNPQVYDRGGVDNQVWFGVHGVVWIDEYLPGAGNIMVFNNGDRPGTIDDYSGVDEILPPQSSPGDYVLDPGLAFGPAAPVWRYEQSGFFSATLGGAYRMPNGNTLICDGRNARIFEVTAGGTTVWTFLSIDNVHRAPRYWAPVSAAPAAASQSGFAGAHPNPFNPLTQVAFAVEREGRVTITVYDVTGRRVVTLTDAVYREGIHTVTWTGKDAAGRDVPSGTYLIEMKTEGIGDTRKVMLVR